MKPASLDYVAATTVAEALDALAEYGGEAKVMAGGQSLVPIMNLRLARPAAVIDINGIPGLGDVRREDGMLVVGALVRQLDAERSPEVASSVPLLPQALRFVGHVAIRSRGTVVGSVVHADPAAELPAVLLALDGELVAESRDGRRTIPAADLFETSYTTSLREDELAIEVRFPVAGAGSRSCFLEVARRHGDFAMVAVGVTLDVEGSVVTSARIAIAAVQDVPVRAAKAEQLLVGVDVGDGAAIQAAGREAASEIEPEADLHASSDYRREVTSVLVARAVTDALTKETR